MKKVIIIGGSVVLASGLLSDTRRFALAERRWQHDHSLLSLLHLGTSGLFLAEDIARLW
jgi:formate hydrogenlyase subunit 3/multisubunit Na+/H+ antiporter MnhD subunit